MRTVLVVPDNIQGKLLGTAALAIELPRPDNLEEMIREAGVK